MTRGLMTSLFLLFEGGARVVLACNTPAVDLVMCVLHLKSVGIDLKMLQAKTEKIQIYFDALVNMLT